jgi:hypothetical protein
MKTLAFWAPAPNLNVMSVSEQSRAGSWQSIAGTKLLVLCVAQNRTPVTARIYERFEISPL